GICAGSSYRDAQSPVGLCADRVGGVTTVVIGCTKNLSRGEPASDHRSRANLRRPQWGSLRLELNTRSAWRFNARMTPIRANIVGPPDSATRIRSFHDSLPFRGLVLGLWKFHDVVAGIFERDEGPPSLQLY